MAVSRASDPDSHEQVLAFHDSASGLRGIVAIHDRSLGPAMGGCRMWPYVDGAAAMRDALRLSRGMSFKNALADLPLGGGKAVIIGDPRKDKNARAIVAARPYDKDYPTPALDFVKTLKLLSAVEVSSPPRRRPTRART